jgi:hypothetical protein
MKLKPIYVETFVPGLFCLNREGTIGTVVISVTPQCVAHIKMHFGRERGGADLTFTESAEPDGAAEFFYSLFKRVVM